MRNEFKKTCAICGYVDTRLKSQLWRHVQNDHGITPKEYYDKYIKEDKDPSGKCLLEGCNNDTLFRGIRLGYDSCCCRSHQLKLSWSREERVERQREVGRNSMKIINEKLWSDKDFRQRQSERMSIFMHNKNTQDWKDPAYREKKISRIRKLMSDKKFLSYLHKNRFINNYSDGLFYLIIRSNDFKIGITHCQGEDKLGHMWSKLSKYAEKDSRYLVWYGSSIDIASLEEYFKMTYNSTKGLEFFDNSLLEEFINIINLNNLKPVKSA